MAETEMTVVRLIATGEIGEVPTANLAFWLARGYEVVDVETEVAPATVHKRLAVLETVIGLGGVDVDQIRGPEGDVTPEALAAQEAAEGAASAADGSKTAAAGSASTASAAAGVATTKAGEASASASSASGSAATATGAAATATSQAGIATTAATSATGSASAASADAGDAETARAAAVVARTGAESAETDAQGHRAAVEAVVATTAGLMASVDADPGSNFRTQQDLRLSTTYVGTGGRLKSQVTTAGADQTAALNAEILALNTLGGGTLLLPPGEITIAGTVNLKSRVNIEGVAGRYRNSAVGGKGSTLLYTGTGTAVTGNRITNVSLRHFAIKASAPSGTSMKGLYLNGAWYTYADDIAVIDFLEANGDAILVDVDTTFGAYKLSLRNIDAFGGVVRFVGNGATTLVTTTVLDTCWAARYEATDAMATWINCTPENWAATYTGTGKGGFTFDGYGHHVLLHANMEHGAGDYTGIVVKGTFTGKGVEEVGTAWQGFAASNRVIGTLGPYIKNNSVDRFEWYNLAAADRKRVREMGQQEPNGSYEMVVEDFIATAVGGGSQTAHRMMARKILGTLKDYWDDGIKWALRNTKTLAADGSTTTFFTIPANTGGGVNGFTVRIIATGTHTGNGQIGSVREYVVAAGPAVAALAAQVNAGVNTLTVAAAVSGNNIIITGSLAATGSASSVTLHIEVLGITQSGITIN